MDGRPATCTPYLLNAETHMRWALEAIREHRFKDATSNLISVQIFLELATEWVKTEVR